MESQTALPINKNKGKAPGSPSTITINTNNKLPAINRNKAMERAIFRFTGIGFTIKVEAVQL
jgi:hypothetical protein